MWQMMPVTVSLFSTIGAEHSGNAQRLRQRANSAVDIVMRGQSLGAYKQALHLLGRDRVRRLDPRVPDNLYKLDKLSTDQLIAKAAHESRIFGPIFSTEFQSHVARDYAPIYK